MDPLSVIYLFLVFFLLAFLVDILPFVKTARDISSRSQNSLSIIRSDLDDDSKQAALLKNSIGIFKGSMLIVLFTALLAGLLILLLEVGYLIPGLGNAEQLAAFLITLNGLFLSVAAFLSYFTLKYLNGRLRI
jgi:Na+(H+)/acetate symporter ActP